MTTIEELECFGLCLCTAPLGVNSEMPSTVVLGNKTNDDLANDRRMGLRYPRQQAVHCKR